MFTIVLFLLLGTLFYKYNEDWTFMQILFWTFSTVTVSTNMEVLLVIDLSFLCRVIDNRLRRSNYEV